MARLQIVGRTKRARWEYDLIKARKANRTVERLAKNRKSFKRKLNHSFNPLEYKMSCILRELGLKFKRNASFGKYFVDFWLQKEQIAIETDGKCHAGREKYDFERDAYLTALGIKVRRYPSTQVFHAPSAVKADVASLCGLVSEAAKAVRPS